MRLDIKEISHDSSEYKLAVALRMKILREPLGLKFSDEDLAEEKGDIHIVAFHEALLIGVLLLRPQKDGAVKMRQVAVDKSVQGSGIGRQLVDASEHRARSMGASEIHLHARESAIPFYLKLGYELEGEPFQEVGIPHLKMKKKMK